MYCKSNLLHNLKMWSKQNCKKLINQKSSELFEGYFKICPSQIKHCFFSIWCSNIKNALLDKPGQYRISTKKMQFRECLWARLLPGLRSSCTPWPPATVTWDLLDGIFLSSHFSTYLWTYPCDFLIPFWICQH